MDKKTCFFVSPIGEKISADRRRSDEVMTRFLEPALEEEFDIIRADLLFKPDKLDDEIFRYLEEADLVAVDITTNNPNVFLELGYRKALGKPFFCIKENDNEPIPFDMKTFYVHRYQLKSDYPSEASINIQDAIDGIQKMVSHFSFDSENLPKQTFEEKVERKLDEIKSNVSNISRNIQKNNETRQFDTTILPIEKVIPRLLDLGVDNPARLEALFAQVRSMLQQIRNIR
ncbi:hypothetical protein ACTJ5V_11385 [Streptococcus suis]|uniref:hypothetical protein n=1 Tax=Streptococcus suis TaxID=1307 RepID=UPI003F88AF5C